jgi:opacity protein-like surface antigen
MKKLISLFTIIFALLLMLDVAYAGGGNRIGTAGASELLIPVGPRGIAMGEANAATSYGLESLFWNPAGVARMNNSSQVIFSHMSYIADIGVEYGAVAANFEGFGALALSIKGLSIGDIPVTTNQNPDGTGATFSPQMLVAGLSYSRQLTDNISIGLTGNFISETLGDVSASGVSFDVGVIYDNLIDLSGFSLGVVLKNIGPQMTYSGTGLLVKADIVGDLKRPPAYYSIDAAPFELPSNFQLALGYKRDIDEMNALQFSGIYQNNNFSGDEAKIGAEYGYNNMFFIRAGYQFAVQEASDYIYGFTAGAGINYNLEGGFSIKIDYAYRYAEYFDGSNVFALTLGF